MQKDESFLSSLCVDNQILENIRNFSSLHGKRYFYINNYKNDYFEHLKKEFNSIVSQFPNIKFIAEARIKSYSSYNEKANKIIHSKFFRDIYDIFGCRYIITSVNGSTDENTIISFLYELKDFLSYHSPNTTILPERTKNYIKKPKDSTYQSLHITQSHSSNNNYHSEVQLRTPKMHLNAHSGNASHLGIYKKRIPGITPVPIFLEFEFNDKGFCESVHEKSYKKSFEHFFGIPFDPKKFSDEYEK